MADTAGQRHALIGCYGQHHQSTAGSIFYVKDRYMRKVSVSGGVDASNDVPLVSLSRRPV